MDNEEFLTILNQYENKLKEIVEANAKVTHSKIINEVDRAVGRVDVVDTKVDRIVKHQEWQNGKLERHDKEIIDLQKKDIKIENEIRNSPANRLAVKITKKKTWAIALGAFVFVYIVLATLYHEVGVGEMIRLMFFSL